VNPNTVEMTDTMVYRNILLPLGVLYRRQWRATTSCILSNLPEQQLLDFRVLVHGLHISSQFWSVRRSPGRAVGRLNRQSSEPVRGSITGTAAKVRQISDPEIDE
jgi:hypothetical protein